MEHPTLALLLLTAAISSLPVASPSSADAPSAAGSPFPASIFVLGDATANCGDNTFLPTLPLTPLCLGSRHRLLPDLIAEKMGLPPPPPFYGANLTLPLSGVNFGSSPATILSGGRSFLYQSLGQQARQAAEVVQMIHLDAGPAAAAARVANASLFVLSFGTDDYLDVLSRGGSRAVGLKFGRRGVARILVSQMVRAVKGLYNAGARRIACFGVGLLGCTPRIAWEGMWGSKAGNCIEEVNEIVSGYNTKLATRLLKLNSELTGLQIVFCDIYAGMLEIISNAQLHGFSNVRDACCGVGVFGGMMGCLTPEMACSDPSSHVWWDFYGATEAVNMLLANWSWSPPETRFQICNPVTLNQLVSAQ